MKKTILSAFCLVFAVFIAHSAHAAGVVKNLSITAPAQVTVGQIAQIKVLANFEAGRPQDVTKSSTFSVHPTSVISIDKLGRVTALSAGSAEIRVGYDSKYANQKIKVIKYVGSVELNEDGPCYKDTIIINESMMLSMTATLGDGNKVTPIPAKPFLHSSDEAVISFEVLSGNLTVAKGMKEGTAEVYAEYEGVKSPPLTLTVVNKLPLPKVLQAFDVKGDLIFVVGAAENGCNDYVWKAQLVDGKLEVLNVFGGSGPSAKEFGKNVQFNDIVAGNGLNIYVAYNGGIANLATDGKYFMKFDTSTSHEAIAIDDYGNLYATHGNEIWVYDSNNGKLAEKIPLANPNIKTKDMAYFNGMFYILDPLTVQKFDKDGTLLGSWPMNNRSKLDIDGIGNFYVSFKTSTPDVIEKYSPSGQLIAKHEISGDYPYVYSFDVTDGYDIYISTGDPSAPIMVIKQ